MMEIFTFPSSWLIFLTTGLQTAGQIFIILFSVTVHPGGKVLPIECGVRTFFPSICAASLSHYPEQLMTKIAMSFVFPARFIVGIMNYMAFRKDAIITNKPVWYSRLNKFNGSLAFPCFLLEYIIFNYDTLQDNKVIHVRATEGYFVARFLYYTSLMLLLYNSTIDNLIGTPLRKKKLAWKLRMFFFLALYLSWGVLAICAVFIELDSCVITHVHSIFAISENASVLFQAGLELTFVFDIHSRRSTWRWTNLEIAHDHKDVKLMNGNGFLSEETKNDTYYSRNKLKTV